MAYYFGDCVDLDVGWSAYILSQAILGSGVYAFRLNDGQTVPLIYDFNRFI